MSTQIIPFPRINVSSGLVKAHPRRLLSANERRYAIDRHPTLQNHRRLYAIGQTTPRGPDVDAHALGLMLVRSYYLLEGDLQITAVGVSAKPDEQPIIVLFRRNMSALEITFGHYGLLVLVGDRPGCAEYDPDFGPIVWAATRTSRGIRCLDMTRCSPVEWEVSQ